MDRSLRHSLSLRSMQLVNRSLPLSVSLRSTQFFARFTRQDASNDLLFVKFEALDRLEKRCAQEKHVFGTGLFFIASRFARGNLWTGLLFLAYRFSRGD